MPEGQIFRRCCQMNETGAIFKAETHDATRRCDRLRQQIVKIIAAATEFCPFDLWHEFKLV